MSSVDPNSSHKTIPQQPKKSTSSGDRKSRPSGLRTFRNLLAVILAAATVLILAGNLFTRSLTYSSVENRMLAEWPKNVSLRTLWDGSWEEQFTSYYNDHFVLRDQWVRLRYSVLKALGYKEFKDGFIGEDGYLFAAPETPDKDQQEKILQALSAYQSRNSSLRYTFILVPDAAAVITDKLPKDAPVRDQQADIDEFISQISGMTCVDAGQILRDAEKAQQDLTSGQTEGDPLYYKTDHHWTSLGAYEVFLGSTSALGIDQPVSYQSYLVSNTFQGTLSSRSGCTSSYDKIYVYEPTDDTVQYVVSYLDTTTKSASVFQTEKLSEKDQYQVFFGGNHPIVQIQTTCDTGRHLLVIKDSFANCFVPFLLPYYDTITMVDPRYCYESADALTQQNSITDVLFLYSADGLWKDTYLADFLNN